MGWAEDRKKKRYENMEKYKKSRANMEAPDSSAAGINDKNEQQEVAQEAASPAITEMPVIDTSPSRKPEAAVQENVEVPVVSAQDSGSVNPESEVQNPKATPNAPTRYLGNLRDEVKMLQDALIASDSPLKKDIIATNSKMLKNAMLAAENLINKSIPIDPGKKAALENVRNDLDALAEATDDKKGKIYSAVRSAVNYLENGLAGVREKSMQHRAAGRGQ